METSQLIRTDWFLYNGNIGLAWINEDEKDKENPNNSFNIPLGENIF